MAVPAPKNWANGDGTSAATLNTEWRDSFNWLLRGTSPAFYAHNGDAGALTFTVNAGVPLKTELLKRGAITHAANDSKVFVGETGWYLAIVQMGMNVTSATGTTFTPELKVNGTVVNTADFNRTTATLIGMAFQSSVFLTSGDYVEIAVIGWTGTATGGTTIYTYPSLGLWWRNK